MAAENMAQAVEKAKRKKKLSKVVEGNVVTITESITGKVTKYDVTALPKEIQAKLPAYGLSQKLGDAAAGKEGQEAVDSIAKVWEGLMKNDWTTRVPAAEKISKSDILDRFNKMDAKAKDALAKVTATNPAMKEMLEKLGLKF